MPTLTTLPDWCAPVLLAFAAKHGRNWKAELVDLWYSGQDQYTRLTGFPEAGSVLRQVRNHPQRDEILALVAK